MSSHGGERQGDSKLSSVSSNKGTNPIMRTPPLQPNYLPKVLLPNTITLGSNLLIWGRYNSVHSPGQLVKPGGGQDEEGSEYVS